MKSIIYSASKFVWSFAAGAHALQSSSVPQEGETVSTDVQPPVLTIDSLVKDVEQIYKEGAWKLVNSIMYFVDNNDNLRGNILGTNNYGRDFLYLVCRSLDDESQAVVLAELLLSKYKWNPNSEDDDGDSALISAASANRRSLVKLLVQYGADLDHQDKDEYTALNEAAMYGHLGVVEFLLESGANTSLENKQGMTALQVAQNYHKHEVVAIFKKHEYRKSFAVVLGLNRYTTQQIVARKNQTNGEGLFKVGKAALLHILSFLKVKGE